MQKPPQKSRPGHRPPRFSLTASPPSWPATNPPASWLRPLARSRHRPLTPGDVLENGFLLWADAYDLQSDADHAAHKAMPIHVALSLAGSVETLLIEIDVSL